MHADRDINIGAGQTTQLEIQGKQTTSKGTFKSSTTTTNSSAESTTSVGSSFSGGTVAMTANNDITIEGSHISGTNGVLVDAGRNLTVYEGRNTSSASLETDTQTRGIGFGGGSLPIVGPVKKGSGTGIEVSSNTASASTIQSSQGGVLLQGGGTVTLQGVQVDAAKDITIHGGNVDIHAAVDGQSLAIAHKSNDLNLGSETWYRDPSTGFNAKKTQEAGITDTSLARTTLNGANVNITAEDTLAMAGTTVNTPGKLSLTADTLVLGTQATEHGTQETSQGRDLMYQKAKDKGTTDQTTNYNQFNAGSLAVSANHVQAGVGARDSIEQLAQLPGMGWIEQLQNDPNLSGKVDWAKVEEAHKDWNYSQQGLTPEGAAIVTVVVSYFSWGAASGAGTAAGNAAAAGAGEGVALTSGGAFLTGTGATISGAVGGAVAAGVSALAGQAAVALINNQGDIGKALDELGSSSNVKNLLTAIATGGVLGGLNLNPTGLPTTGAGATDVMKQLGTNLTAGAAKAVISTAINGGSLEDALRDGIINAVLDTAAATGATWIGDEFKGIANRIAHAIAGCAVGAARTDGSCAAGALGAVVGELSAELYGRDIDTVQFANMMSSIAAAIAGGDANQINLAGQAGANAAANNYLKHDEAARLDQLKEKRLAGRCDSACDFEIKTLETLDASRNADFKACQGQSSPSCQTLVAEVRHAAADYIRINAPVLGITGTYLNERGETIALAQSTMGDYTVWNVGKGVASSVWETANSAGKALYTGFEAVLGDPQAQQQVEQGLGAAWDFVQDPQNWPQLLGAMSPTQREELARAYEAGDGAKVASVLGEQLLNTPVGGGAGTIKTIVKVSDRVEEVAALAKRLDVDRVVEVPVGAKGNWDPAINPGTTGSLMPKTAYVLDNGSTYVTDASGRVNAVEGTLTREVMDRNGYQQCVTGKCSGVAKDEGGHLIAASLGGAGDGINIVPQPSTLNRGDWRAMENEFRDAIKAGKTVTVKIDVGYPSDRGIRPSTFFVEANIDGVIKEYPFTQ